LGQNKGWSDPRSSPRCTAGPALHFPCLILARRTPHSFSQRLLIPGWSCDLDRWNTSE